MLRCNRSISNYLYIFNKIFWDTFNWMCSIFIPFVNYNYIYFPFFGLMVNTKAFNLVSSQFSTSFQANIKNAFRCFSRVAIETCVVSFFHIDICPFLRLRIKISPYVSWKIPGFSGALMRWWGRAKIKLFNSFVFLQ